MKVIITVDGMDFEGQAGTWDEAEEAAMLAYAAWLQAEKDSGTMAGSEDQAWLQWSIDQCTHHGLAYLDVLIEDGAASRFFV